MRKRPLGASSSQVTELGLGTWGLSGDGYGPVREAEQDRVIERALAMGIRLFDTADCYGEGFMEARLGRLLPGDAFVVTKIGTRREVKPPRKDFSVGYLRDAFQRSRDRLRRETIDCVLLHNPSLKVFENAEVPELFQELSERGWIRTWGVSAGNFEVGRAALTAGAKVLSIAFNVFHAGDLRALGGDLAQNEAGVLVHSVLSHGLLCGQWPVGKEFPEGDHRADRWTVDELKKRVMQLNALRSMVADDAPTPRAIALRFALAEERISSVLLGPRSAVQLDQLVREAGKEPPYLTPDRLDALRERLANVGVYA
jgi:aryl-alcohol dehydrogenase-like predicted oxidoreductase